MCPLNTAERYFARVRERYPGIDRYFIEVLTRHRTPQEALSLSDLKGLYDLNLEYICTYMQC